MQGDLLASGTGLPEAVQRSVTAFVDAAKEAFGEDLVSILLFGSAAEQRLRATSDVNILLVLKRFDQAQADLFREPLRLAHAAVNVNAMFLLEAEIPAALDAFAMKFADILSRHRVLHGSNPFAGATVSNSALLFRVRQDLLNLQIRLRQRYILISLREEQLGRVIADAASPLRASAASILHIEGESAPSPKIALERLVARFNDPAFGEVLSAMSAVRAGERLAPGRGQPVLLDLMRLTERLHAEADRLPASD